MADAICRSVPFSIQLVVRAANSGDAPGLLARREDVSFNTSSAEGQATKATRRAGVAHFDRVAMCQVISGAKDARAGSGSSRSSA